MSYDHAALLKLLSVDVHACKRAAVSVGNPLPDTRLKSSFKSSNYSFWKFYLNPAIILKIIPTKIHLITLIYADLLINSKRIIYFCNYNQLP